MADEKEVRDIASNTPANAGVSPAPIATQAAPTEARPAVAPTANDPEPVIIEEIVIKKAPTPVVSAVAPQIAVRQAPEPVPAPVPSGIAPRAPEPRPVPTPTSEEVPDVGLPTHNTAAATPPTPTAREQSRPLDITTPKSGALGTDIADILKSVQLPERRNTGSEKQIENKAAVFDTLASTSEPTPSESATPVTPTAPEEDSTVVPLRTLKNDIQHAVKDQRMTLVRAVSLEEDKRAHDPREAPPTFATGPTSHRALYTILGALGLVALGATALYAVYAVAQSRNAGPQQIRTSSLLFAENAVPFSIDDRSPDSLKQSLAAARSSLQGTLGSITQLVPMTGGASSTNATATARPATFSEFMRAIGAHPPAELVGALSDTFFFGIHAADKNAPVLVIPVLSYERAFAGMLAWEPNMNAELAPIFTAVPATIIDQQGLPAYRTFQDLTMRNYDVRALKDDAGNVELYYSFPSQQILIIAESPYSFAEVLSRLQAAREL